MGPHNRPEINMDYYAVKPPRINQDWVGYMHKLAAKERFAKIRKESDAASILQRKYDGKYPALIVAVATENKKLLRLLLDAGADADAAIPEGETPLAIAYLLRDMDTIQELLSCGANPDIKDSDGIPLLINACRHDDLELASLLIRHGANLDIQGKLGFTPLMWASANGHTEITKMLLANGADPNIQDSFGGTALLYASDAGHTTDVKCLLLSDADPDIPNKNNRTALHEAAHSGKTEIVKCLLAMYAQPALRDAYGKTPRDLTGNSECEHALNRATSRFRPSLPTLEEMGLHNKDILAPAAVAEEPALTEMPVLGDFTRRLVAANTSLRAQDEAMESYAQTAIAEKFLAALVLAETIGEEQLAMLNGAGAKLSRRYRDGGDTRWDLKLWVDAGQKRLLPAMEDMREAMQAAAPKTAVNGINNPSHAGISIRNQQSLETIIRAFNAALPEKIGKIDMNELHAAAKASARAAPTRDLGR